MADGVRLSGTDDGAEQAALAVEAALLKHVRWRLVAWSGISTMLVLLVLSAILYAVVANTLAAASIAQLDGRADPVIRLIEDPTGRRPEFGFEFGGGNTLLYLFDDAGTPIQGERQVVIPGGLPEPDGVAAARVDGRDVRTDVLVIESRGDTEEVPIRILTRSVVATDGNTYFLQVLQDRSTEVSTLDALLLVLVVGGILVIIVSVGFGTLYASRAMVPIRESLTAQRMALRRQREFAADASHELRTPLTVIRSSVEHLQRHADEPVRRSQDALDDIDAEVSHLATLVDDLLLLARSDSGAIALDQVTLDLGDVALEAASVLGRMAESRGVEVRVDPAPAMVLGDPARLRQLVTILVDNAVRHSPRGSSVDVTVRADPAIAWIDVADRGPGVRPEDMPHVFDRFWRAPGAPSGGTGLGLSIAHWITGRHGGRIGVANRPDGGAVFRVELPLAGIAPVFGPVEGPGSPDILPG
jgi:two-component system sensor histidine kinase CiaH